MKTILFATIAVLFLFSAAAYAITQTENDKIQYLITSVENLDGAKFIRNGTDHSAKDAASHLRMKLQKAGKRVKTADDFIKLCASQSYLSGEPYSIRFADGKTVKTADYFRGLLRKYNAGGK
jgi:hypothetical protein